MGFTWPGMPPAITNLELSYFSPTEFQIRTPFEYVDRPSTPSERLVLVRAAPDGITDFASVPSFLWGIVASYGRQLPAALVHDQLCNDLAKTPPAGFDGNPAPNPDGDSTAVRRQLRDYADGLFLRALQDESLGDERMPMFKARVMWGGVSAARYVAFHRIKGVAALVGMAAGWFLLLALINQIHLRASWSWSWALVLWVTALLAAMTSVIVGSTKAPRPWLYCGSAFVAVTATIAGLWELIPGTENPNFLAWKAFTDWHWLVVVAFVVVTMALVLGRDWSLVPLLATVIPVVLPVVASTVVARVILWIPDAIIGAFTGKISPPIVGITKIMN